EIPANLSETDREETLRILAFGTANKLLTDPYPLGGYSGVEVGVSIESVPVEDISNMGDETKSQESFVYPKLSIGKGLYENIDVFVSLVPQNESTGIGQYGGLAKWSFYQATFMPASFSLSVFGSDTNIRNQLFAQTGGFSLTTGITMNYISFYFGGGQIYATGRFIGGADGLTDTGVAEQEHVDMLFFVFGAVIRVEPVFAAVELSQYSQPVISGKLGFRF
ncbi:MAG: hypothetical protein KDD25_02395, partial [Bdellovibrionales bacterium]|nr:hypothetical protein [Bdellovibrionales bacterium]